MQAQEKAELNDRIIAANQAIDSAGGSCPFVAKINDYLGADSITLETVKVWRIRGIPERWTTTVEHLTGVPRHKLNPQMYVVRYED